MNKAQVKSQEIGHCVCHMKVKCLCPYFIDKKLCKCGGDKVGEDWADYNLTHQKI